MQSRADPSVLSALSPDEWRKADLADEEEGSKNDSGGGAEGGGEPNIAPPKKLSDSPVPTPPPLPRGLAASLPGNSKDGESRESLKWLPSLVDAYNHSGILWFNRGHHQVLHIFARARPRFDCFRKEQYTPLFLRKTIAPVSSHFG